MRSASTTAHSRRPKSRADMATPLGLAPPPPPPPGGDQVGQWSGITDWPLVPIHMSLLPTGEVLSWDGFGFAPGSATLWNPITNQFTSVPNGPNLFCAGHILMPDGRVLVLGGHVDAYVGITDTTIYNSTSRTWSSAAPMNFPRWYPTVTSLPDGRALVMSGNTNCQTCIADIPEIYDPATNSWSELSSARLKSLPIHTTLFSRMERFSLPAVIMIRCPLACSILRLRHGKFSTLLVLMLVVR